MKGPNQQGMDFIYTRKGIRVYGLIPGGYCVQSVTVGRENMADDHMRRWGRLCLFEGKALNCLGQAHIWNGGKRVGICFAEIGTDEGILGNDFAMRHKLTIRPHKGVVYLPQTPHPLDRVLGKR